jgi:predicted transcriptional regulator
MTYSKTEHFTEDLQRLASIAKVLSHPARLSILQYLAETKCCISGDITDEIPLSRTTVSQHLQELKKAGIIQGTVSGVKINYCLCSSNIQELKRLFDHFFETITVESNTCKNEPI